MSKLTTGMTWSAWRGGGTAGWPPFKALLSHNLMLVKKPREEKSGQFLAGLKDGPEVVASLV